MGICITKPSTTSKDDDKELSSQEKKRLIKLKIKKFTQNRTKIYLNSTNLPQLKRKMGSSTTLSCSQSPSRKASNSEGNQVSPGPPIPVLFKKVMKQEKELIQK